MATKIEWTRGDDGSLGETWNPVTGCSHVSAGCTNCYAERITARFRKDHKPWTAANAKHNVVLHPDRLEIPLHWKKPRKIFVNSMSDLAHEEVPDEFIALVFQVMQSARKHTFQILTKRPDRMMSFFGRVKRWEGWYTLDGEEIKGYRGNAAIIGDDDNWPPQNVWLGVSVEDQKTADERIPLLLQTPAAVRFVSYEPALGAVDFGIYLSRDNMFPMPGFKDPLPGLNWIIAGGESGPGARPSHPDWFRSVRDQCQAAGVPFFFKQWGEWLPSLDVPSGHADTYSHKRQGSRNPCQSLGDELMVKVGKKAAGRLLDGRTWDQFPGANRG